MRWNSRKQGIFKFFTFAFVLINLTSAKIDVYEAKRNGVKI